MKILVISNLYPPHYVGGYELHCRTIAEGLRSRGHEVQILTSDHQVENVPSCSEPQVHRCLKIHGMFGHPWLPIQQLKNQERHNNRMLREVLRQVKPDVVHCWNFSGLSKSLLFTLRAGGWPTVFCVCDHWVARSEDADVWLSWWNRPNPPLPHRVARRCLEVMGYRRIFQAEAPTNPVKHLDFQRISFCSSSLRDFTAAAGFDVSHGTVIYCPINTNRFTGVPRSLGAPMQRLLYVGRLTEDKGVMTALRAMARLRDKFDGRLNIYGRGEPEYEAQLKAFVEKEKLPVTFAGGAQIEDMPGIYGAHDALLFTSEWAEPFALTPLEAMACGLPVIGTMTGGSVELFRHGENALTYQAGMDVELAQRIIELDRDRALRLELAMAGQAEVRSRCAEPVILGKVEAYLQESLATWQRVALPNYNA
jgi:glycosyltransferase involved in cell wall biosynthesis